MNGHMCYADQLEGFRKSDAERDALVAKIIQDYEELKVKVEEITDDYKNEVQSRRMWQTKAAECERAVGELRQQTGSNNFVLVLIDGDGAIFSDYLLAMGKDGGAEAAHLLHTEVQKHLQSLYPEANVADWNIMVQVVLNLQGLAMKLQSCGVIANANELVAFGRAFGLAQPLFSFVDVGIGKERADHKIRETLRLYLRINQCKHVFFAPCHDNGYLPVLESYRREHATRLTLVETRPAERGFLALGLKIIQMPQIFRSNDLGTIPTKATPYISPEPTPVPVRTKSNIQVNAASFTPAMAKPASPSPSVESAGSAANSSSWAAVGKSGAASKSINIAPKKSPPVRPHILLNVYDERLDSAIPRTEPGAEARFTERLKTKGKVCNKYYLAGKCEAGEYCGYSHSEKLTPGELLVLKHKARSMSCPKKFTCRDVKCYLGHVCKYSSNGQGCLFDPCYFPDTHGMDMEPAKRVYEDGTEEWLPGYLNKVRPQ